MGNKRPGEVAYEESFGGGDAGADEGGEMESILETPVGLVNGLTSVTSSSSKYTTPAMSAGGIPQFP
ncbi:hypothetical protein PS2_032225 [Malus domestica]